MGVLLFGFWMETFRKRGFDFRFLAALAALGLPLLLVTVLHIGCIGFKAFQPITMILFVCHLIWPNPIHNSNTWVDHPMMILFVCHLIWPNPIYNSNTSSTPPHDDFIRVSPYPYPSSSAMVSILHFCTIYFFMWIIIWLTRLIMKSQSLNPHNHENSHKSLLNKA